MSFQIQTFLTLFMLNNVITFNVDTHYPIVFKSNLNKEDYFGLSLQMQKNGNETIFLIGAPKASTKYYNVETPGTVFKCHIEYQRNVTTVCNEIHINYGEISETRNSYNTIVHIQPTDKMFFGGTIVTQPNTNRFIACGHSWANKYDVGTASYSINPLGSCYMFNSQNNSQAVGMFPMVNRDFQYKNDTYFYASAMSGLSATFSEKGDTLWLGAPGFYQWRGTFLEMNKVTDDINRATKRFVTEKFVLQRTSSTETESYFGYSISSGHFLSGIDSSIAAGAPRDLNYRGRVYIYNFNNGNHDTLNTVQYTTFEGTRMGEYFGASLLAVNINGDKYSDLLIGAPFYSPPGQTGDRGRVFVYISNGNGFNSPKILLGSNKANSRFGSAIANLGDLNFDGINDIAIGAPYEDERGAIYIYHGHKTKVNTQYSQRISAEENFSGLNLKGFGISIAGNTDADGNKYPDIFVGSYLSNKAILLRTNPVARIKTNVTVNIDQINLNNKKCTLTNGASAVCFNITHCIKYDGIHIPSRQKFRIHLQLDNNRPLKSRCYVQKGKERASVIIQNVTLDANSNMKCSTPITVYLLVSVQGCPKLSIPIFTPDWRCSEYGDTSFWERNSLDDVFTPIQLKLNYDFVFNKPNDSFCPNCPVEYQKDISLKELPFEISCGSDKKCVSNLILNVEMLLNNIISNKDAVIIEGMHKNLTLNFRIKNFGEPSYSSKLIVNVAPAIHILKQNSKCILPNNENVFAKDISIIECDVGNPLNINEDQQLSIPFDLTHLNSHDTKIQFILEVTTKSDLNPNSRVKEEITLFIKRNAAIEIKGNSLKSEETYENADIRKNDVIPFEAAFQVIKYSESTIDNVRIRLTFPISVNGHPIVFRPQIETKGVSINCNDTLIDLPVLPLKSKQNPSLPASSKARSEKIVHKSRRKRDAIISDVTDDEFYNERRTLILNCSSSSVTCYEMNCYSGPYKADKQIAQLKFASALNISTIERNFVKSDYTTIKFVFAAKAEILDNTIDSSANLSDSSNVVIVFKRIATAAEPISKWIIFVAIGIGLLILIIIVFALIKCGFFRRTKKEEMEKLTYKNNLENELLENNKSSEFQYEDDENDDNDHLSINA